MAKPRLLDLFCGAGGCSVGYHQAGFDVVGVDLFPQPRYPFEFHQADAIEYILQYGAEFDVIHASPVCKKYSTTANFHRREIDHPDQIPNVRNALKSTGKPYVIENVVGAPLLNYVMLCGSMFGLLVYRHRLFECNPMIAFPPASCNHWGKASGNSARNQYGKRIMANLADFDIISVSGHDFNLQDAKRAMGIDWMTRDEIAQAIPPAYTEWLGKTMLSML